MQLIALKDKEMNREELTEQLRLLGRILPIVKADAQMMSDITRFAPLPFEEQARNDNTETDSERLVNEIPKAMALLEAKLARPDPVPLANGCRCPICKGWQHATPSGMTCSSGHGGEQGINTPLYTKEQLV